GITDYLVLEWQDYIGGRMKVVPFAGIKVELGANWIHYFDEEENPLVPLRDKHNLRGHLSNYSNVRARNDSGVDVTDIKLYKEWHKAKEEMFKMGEERGEKDVQPRDMPASTA
ncbi:unnamed protein product, partial [Porites evermanni]